MESLALYTSIPTEGCRKTPVLVDVYITYLQLYTLTDGGGVASREGICAETHEEAGFPHIQITHHQYLEDVVRLRGQILNELQGLGWEVGGQSVI